MVWETPSLKRKSNVVTETTNIRWKLCWWWTVLIYVFMGRWTWWQTMIWWYNGIPSLPWKTTLSFLAVLALAVSLSKLYNIVIFEINYLNNIIGMIHDLLTATAIKKKIVKMTHTHKSIPHCPNYGWHFHSILALYINRTSLFFYQTIAVYFKTGHWPQSKA